MANSNGAVAMSLAEAKVLVMEGQKGDPGKSPRINPENNHWEVYDNDTEQWVDTGVNADVGSVTPYTIVAFLGPGDILFTSSSAQDICDHADNCELRIYSVIYKQLVVEPIDRNGVRIYFGAVVTGGVDGLIVTAIPGETVTISHTQSPFAIPVTADTTTTPTTYSTTASLEDIIAHRKNLVVTFYNLLFTYDGYATSGVQASDGDRNGVFYFSARHFTGDAEYVSSFQIEVSTYGGSNTVTVTKQDYHVAATPN